MIQIFWVETWNLEKVFFQICYHFIRGFLRWIDDRWAGWKLLKLVKMSDEIFPNLVDRRDDRKWHFRVKSENETNVTG